MPTTVQAIGLTKKYNLGNEMVHAVDDVSLSVQAGELVAITGRPGSGKSSLLHILGCLQRPDPGRLWIDGLEVTPLRDDELALVRARRIGFVYQAFNLLPNENAVRNVELPLKSQSVPAYECREKADQALRTVGLGHCVEYPLHQLSAAQRQLVSIARALVNDPSVIFLDEPTRGLDSTSREELMGLLQKLNDQGRTIVMTTKDPVEARYCLRMVKLGEGKILENILVSNQRIVPSSKVPGTVPKSHEREVAFCPRCNYSNFKDQEVCKRCECPLELTDDEVESIEGRLSGSNNAHLGVEDDIEEEEEPQGQIDDVTNELKEIPFFGEL